MLLAMGSVVTGAAANLGIGFRGRLVQCGLQETNVTANGKTYAKFTGYANLQYNETFSVDGSNITRRSNILLPTVISLESVYQSQLSTGAVRVESKYVVTWSD
jgi:hypothetical protein